MLYNTMALFINVHNIPVTNSRCRLYNRQMTRYGSDTQWVTFRDARFENISAKITALREVTPCSLINKYQRLEQSAASIFRK